VDALHKAHTDLIQHVRSKHRKVIVFLGTSPLKTTKENPLDFEARKQMILAIFPDINVLYITDTMQDDIWSANLDSQIKCVVGPSQSVELYGGRDSFLSRYSGKHHTTELMQEVVISGSGRRRELSSRVNDSQEFRHGVIWATQNQYAKCQPTVDVAILDETQSKILLGRKRDEAKFRLIGGYIEAGHTAEQTARKDVTEEAGIEINGIQYVSSFVVDDWRYKEESDKITTFLFTAQYTFGKPTPGDDIYEVQWFPISNELLNDVVDTHKMLIAAVLHVVAQSN
jgi:bifunctional NMN adenylyltransferase/nudix hydrolase